MQDFIKEKCKCTEQNKSITEAMCNKCRMLYYRHIRKSQSKSIISNDVDEENNSMSTYQTQDNPDEAHNSHTHSESINKKVKLSIPRTIILDAKCLICDKRDFFFLHYNRKFHFDLYDLHLKRERKKEEI